MGVLIMKKVLSGVAALLMVSSVGFASPLTDYSQGKVAIDLSVRSSNDITSDGYDYDGKTSNFNYGATVGLGNGFAFQYKQDNADSKDRSFGSLYITEHTELKSNQYNVLYQVNPNVSAFVGLINTKPQWKDSAGYGGSGKNTTGYQVGVIGTMPIADKTTVYASLGYGDKIEDYEFGIGYEVATNLELNVGYKDTKFKKLNMNDGSSDFNYKAHGLTYGVTYKF
jgi:hypothetical protein